MDVLEETGIGLSRAGWFANKLRRRYPEILLSEAEFLLERITEVQYSHLKHLHWRAFATSIYKTEDVRAREELEQELKRLGVL